MTGPVFNPTDFAAKVKGYSLAEIEHALTDVRETLAIWREADPRTPYVVKLWAEWDALIEARRMRLLACPKNPRRRKR